MTSAHHTEYLSAMIASYRLHGLYAAGRTMDHPSPPPPNSSAHHIVNQRRDPHNWVPPFFPPVFAQHILDLKFFQKPKGLPSVPCALPPRNWQEGLSQHPLRDGCPCMLVRTVKVKEPVKAVHTRYILKQATPVCPDLPTDEQSLPQTSTAMG